MDSEFIRVFWNNFLSLFGADYDKELSKKWHHNTSEIQLYFRDGYAGGYSSFYCKRTWNDSTLENDADLEIFDLLFKIDIKNGGDPSKIVSSLCTFGAFEAVKVSNRFFFMKSLLCSVL